MTTWREDLAWAAGFFDGEGWIRTDPKKGGGHARAEMGINQCCIEPLTRFQGIIGFGNINGPYKVNVPGRTPIYTWSVSGAYRTQAIVAMLWEFLSQPMRDEAAYVLKNMYWESQASSVPWKYRTCKRDHPYEGNRTKWGQCRACMREADRARG
jgi:hypothetical protein